MDTRERSFAIVTGASSGIGYELARCCVDHGFDLLIAADDPAIHEAAAIFEDKGAMVEAVQVDLATSAGVDRLVMASKGRPVDALLANAGHGLGGAFLDQDFEQVRHVYNGSKAMLDSFSYALRAERGQRGLGDLPHAGRHRDGLLRTCRHDRHQARHPRQAIREGGGRDGVRRHDEGRSGRGDWLEQQAEGSHQPHLAFDDLGRRAREGSRAGDGAPLIESPHTPPRGETMPKSSRGSSIAWFHVKGAVLAAALGGGCYAGVGYDAPPVGYVQTVEPFYYGGRPHYWYRGHWHYRDGDRWMRYRTEPAPMRQWRQIRPAPTRPLPPPPHVRPAPGPRPGPELGRPAPGRPLPPRPEGRPPGRR